MSAGSVHQDPFFFSAFADRTKDNGLLSTSPRVRFPSRVKAADAAEGSQQEEQRQQQRQLVPVLEKALKDVSIKYKSCLPDFRFPPVYAETINRLILLGAS